MPAVAVLTWSWDPSRQCHDPGLPPASQRCRLSKMLTPGAGDGDLTQDDCSKGSIPKDMFI